jgi:hypothetical protein
MATHFFANVLPFQHISVLFDRFITLNNIFSHFCNACNKSRVELQVSHRVPPQVADRGTLARYGEYQRNQIYGVDQNQYRCLVVDRGICKG